MVTICPLKEKLVCHVPLKRAVSSGPLAVVAIAIKPAASATQLQILVHRFRLTVHLAPYRRLPSGSVRRHVTDTDSNPARVSFVSNLGKASRCQNKYNKPPHDEAWKSPNYDPETAHVCIRSTRNRRECGVVVQWREQESA